MCMYFFVHMHMYADPGDTSREYYAGVFICTFMHFFFVQHLHFPSLTQFTHTLAYTHKHTHTAQLLYNVAALRGGYEIEDGKQFATLVTELMATQ